MCRRAVRVNSQLKSHKRFAEAFMTYCQLVDNARLYFTNALEGPAKVHISLFLWRLSQNLEDHFINKVFMDANLVCLQHLLVLLTS